MHYTERMKHEIREKEETIQMINEELTNMMIYLSSEKFAGFENNFVNAQEMFEKLRNLRNQI